MRVFPVRLYNFMKTGGGWLPLGTSFLWKEGDRDAVEVGPIKRQAINCIFTCLQANPPAPLPKEGGKKERIFICKFQNK